jgi:hypothetical protein
MTYNDFIITYNKIATDLSTNAYNGCILYVSTTIYNATKYINTFHLFLNSHNIKLMIDPKRFNDSYGFTKKEELKNNVKDFFQ